MQLRTERLLLREFCEGDWEAVWAYQNNPLYLRYYEWTDRTQEDVRDFVQMFLNQQQALPRFKFQLAVVLPETGQLIGNCGVRLPEPNALVADIGYELDPSFWGRGYATEAAQTMVDFGFSQLGLQRITAVCLAENGGSARVLAKVGMQQEGRLRQNEYFKDQWWDSLLFGILAREWDGVSP